MARVSATSGDRAALVEARGLRFGYSTNVVLDIDRLAVGTGEVVAVIGHNGSGKTTLLKLINALVGPYEGSLRYGEHEIRTARGRALLRRSAVYLHQHPYLFRESVTANVAFGLRARRIARVERQARIDAALTALGLHELAGRRADSLSGGERQRVALARAVALEPQLLLLDEPTSNIDPASVALIEDAITAARSSGTTVVVSTHNLATAYRVADRVVSIGAGRIVPERNNVYHGQIVARREAVAWFEFDGGRLIVPDVAGDYRTALVPMDDVFLARQELISSAQNQVRGRVVAVEPFESLLRVQLDCGFRLQALVTDKARGQLGLEPGTLLYAGFKASAVRLF